MHKSVTLLTACLLTVACTVVPVKKPHSLRDSACGVSTHEYDLKMVQAGVISASCDSPECVLSIAVVAAAWTGITAIVSGSIVLVGNTIHWLEQQGDCDIERVNQQVNEMNSPLLKKGGKPIKTKEELEREIEEYSE